MKELKTEIIINAPAGRVWQVLTQFDNYPNWNPFIQSVEGKPIEGTTLKNSLQLQGKTWVFTPRITALQEERQLEWLGKMPLGMFNGNHYFLLEKLGEHQTRLLHGERFSGWLSSLMLKKIGEDTLKGFQLMNKALKEEAEAAARV